MVVSSMELETKISTVTVSGDNNEVTIVYVNGDEEVTTMNADIYKFITHCNKAATVDSSTLYWNK